MENNDIIVGAFISDIHIDAADSEMVYYQLKEYFLKPLYKLPVLDLIVFGGDIYHSKIPVDSKASKLSNRFFNKDIPELMEAKNCATRIIKGTDSHDNDQLDNFLHLQEKKELDFKVIKRVEDETFRGFKFLYIPEEYIEDQNEYYKSYSKNRYDMAFGHGMFEKVAFIEDSSEFQMKNAPIFPNNYFMDFVDGPVLFGHIHTPTIVNSQVRYPGSFHTWIMGQEVKKGFLVFVYNKKTKKYLITQVYNYGCKKYITLDLDPYLKYPIETILRTVDYTMKSERVQKLRLDISYEGNNKNKLTNINIIKEYYQGNKNISVNVKNSKLKKSEKQKRDIVNKFKYIFDKNLSIETKLSKFISDEFKENIPEEEIYDILHKDILI